MGYQVVKQPDDQLAIFASYTDTIVMWDADAAEVVQFFVDIAVEDARRRAEQVVAHVVSGEPRKAYFQFAMTWDEALEKDREHGGEVWRVFAGRQDGDGDA